MSVKSAILLISIIGTVLAFALGLIGLLNKGETGKRWLALAVVLMVAVLLINIFEKVLSHYSQAKATSAAAKSGKLKSLSLLQYDAKGPYVQVQIGNRGSIKFRHIKSAADGTLPLFQFSECLNDSELKVRLDSKNRLLFSVYIRDATGDVVARIVENEWQVNPNMAFDRNYTDDAFEVVDKKGEVLLQLCLLPDRIQLQARFFDAQGREAIMCQGVVTGFRKPGHLGPAIRINPMFKYPSALHPGERASANQE